MQTLKALVLVVVCVVMVAVVASAGENMGVANSQRINFTGNVRIGDVLLPQGDYEIKHVMEARTTSWCSRNSAAERQWKPA
jgi:hypothetical protein